MDTPNYRILGFGLATSTLWMSIVWAVDLALEQTTPEAPRFWVVLAVIMGGIVISVGFYLLVNISGNKKPQIVFKVLLVASAVLLLVLLAMTITFGYLAVSISDTFPESLFYSTLILTISPGGSFLVLLSSLGAVALRALLSSKQQPKTPSR